MTKTKENEGLARWERLAKTDPAHTKPFNRGGFKGTALKPIWLIKRMTEEFGTAGEAWGMLEPQFQTVFLPDAKCQPLVYCTAGMWIGSPDRTIYGVGGDTLTNAFKSGTISDDEAFKKAYTDAINNCFKYLGIGGDVHMGQFEDSKYVSDMREAFEDKPECVKHIEEFVEKVAMVTSEDALTTLFEDYAAHIEEASKDHGAAVSMAKQAYAKKLRALRAAMEKQTEDA